MAGDSDACCADVADRAAASNYRDLVEFDPAWIASTEIDADHGADAAHVAHQIDRKIVESPAVAQQITVVHNGGSAPGIAMLASSARARWPLRTCCSRACE